MKKILLLSLLIIGTITALLGQCMEASSDEGVNVVGYIQAQYDHKLEEEATNRFSFNRLPIR